MIVNTTHIRSYDFTVFDCKTQKVVSHVESFDTETKDAIVYKTEEISSGIYRAIVIDGKNIFETVKLSNCILIDCKTQEIVK